MDTSENDLEKKCSEDESDASDDESINDSSENPEYKRLVDLVWNKQDKNHDNYEVQKEILDEVLNYGDLTLASYSFEIMSTCFPLAPDIWKTYINLHKKHGGPENVDKLRELYGRALFDYYSLDLQQDYLATSLGCDVTTIRTLFEEALMREGLHPLYGSKIWESYRFYEASLLSTLEDNEEQKEQLKHLADIIIRQASTPLQQEEDIYDVLTNLNEEVPDLIDVKAVGRRIKKTKLTLDLYLSFEEKLEKITEENSAEKLSIYMNYISAVQNHKETIPKFIESLYYRAITEFCLNIQLWQQFCMYIIGQHKQDPDNTTTAVVDNVLYNALRNVPWGTAIWIIKLRWYEYCNVPQNEIKSTFERALGCCSYKVHTIWMVYLEYLKRNTDFTKDDSIDLLRKTFSLCVDTLQKHWVTNASPVEILKFWARLEYTLMKDPSKGRELWNNVMSYDDNKSEPYLWLEMAKLEEGRGHDQARKIYRRAVLECRSYMLVDAWKTFERMNGTLDTLEKCVQTCDEQAYKLSQQDILKSHNDTPKRRYHFNEKGRDDSKKLKFDEDLKERKKLKAKRNKTDDIKHSCMEGDSNKKSNKSTRKDRESNDGSIKDIEMSCLQIEDRRVKHDPTKDDITIFISNLDYTITEEQLVTALKEKADLEIKETRLVKKPNGTNKGYAYVELKDSEQVQKALKLDRTLLLARPMYISSCHGNKEQRKHGFRYSEELEKNKLFIKGLPFDMDDKELRSLFEPYGEIKDVRIVTYKSGKSKGLAFVEYHDENSASAAILKTDNLTIKNHTISVALSAPPPRKNKFNNAGSSNSETQISSSLGGGLGQSQQGLIRKAKMTFIPRAVQQKATTTGNEAKDVEMSENKPKSNDDFRKMLLGSK